MMMHSLTIVQAFEQPWFAMKRQQSTMVDYKDRLQEAMKDAGVSKQGLADALGVSYQAIKKVLDGLTHSLTAANNDAAALKLGVNSRWLATGKGPKKPSESTPHRVESPPAEYIAQDEWLREGIQILAALTPADRRAAVLSLRLFVAQLDPPRNGQALQVAKKR
jgi:transcriptional regulator with XRE-family HTH domain